MDMQSFANFMIEIPPKMVPNQYQVSVHLEHFNSPTLINQQWKHFNWEYIMKQGKERQKSYFKETLIYNNFYFVFNLE